MVSLLSATAPAAPTMDDPCADTARVEQIVSRYPVRESSLLPVLQDIQRAFGFLPCGALRYVADRLEVPLARVFSIATFYRAFALTPQGRTVVRVCTGTACHLRGSDRLVEELERQLGIAPGETTSDRAFSVKTVNCVGACALAPVLLVGEETFGSATAATVAKSLAAASGKEGSR